MTYIEKCEAIIRCMYSANCCDCPYWYDIKCNYFDDEDIKDIIEAKAKVYDSSFAENLRIMLNEESKCFLPYN